LSFCPNCGKILKVLHKRNPALQCTKCGYKTEFKPDSKSNYNHKIVNHRFNEIALIDETAARLRTFPTVGVICPECGKAGSETWTIPVGSDGTTSSLTFFRCISCGHTRRESG
jgi:DNA-directed RNA polymerase subunit M/transcription elongation factor TFIIS